MRDQNETLIWWEKISYITMEIKNRLVFEGTLMISYMPVPHKNFGNFFRMVVNCQPPPTKSSMDYVINQIQKVASDL